MSKGRLIFFLVTLLMLPVAVSAADWYYKPGYPDYCPAGMPDFSQQQDFTWPPDGVIDPGYCGPTALANCFWWFDSRFEPHPVPPPVYSDYYPLVLTYATMPPFWDDHDPQNVVPLISALATALNTNLNGPGTNIMDMDKGIRDWLQSRDLDDLYTVNQYTCPGLAWPFLAGEVKRSQDVILLLGFYLAINGDPNNCCRIGGHYVTVAGVDSVNSQIAISDPFLDIQNPAVVSHNDVGIVSHDIYDVAIMPPLCMAVNGCLFLPNYPGPMIAWDYYEQNGGTTCPPSQPGPIFTVIEAAEVICPVPCDCRVGDANGDGKYNVGDAVYLVSYIFRGGLPPTPYALCSGDANCDCKLNVGDAVYLVNYIFRGGAAPCDCHIWLKGCGLPLRK